MIKTPIIALSLSLLFLLSGCGEIPPPKDDSPQYFMMYQSLRSFVENARRAHQIEYVGPVTEDESMQAARQKVNEVIAYLDGIGNKLMEFAEIDPATGALTKLNETERTADFLMGSEPIENGPRGSGVATEIRSRLNDYADWANAMVEERTGTVQPPESEYFEGPAQDPVHWPQYPPRIKDQSWEYTCFHGVTVIAALAQIERLKMEVLTIDAALVEFLMTRMSGKFRMVSEMALFESVGRREAKAGEEFEARFYLGQHFPEVKAEYETDGQVEIQEDGSALIRWRAEPTGKSRGEQVYRVTARVPTADGGYMEVPFEGTFYVVK